MTRRILLLVLAVGACGPAEVEDFVSEQPASASESVIGGGGAFLQPNINGVSGTFEIFAIADTQISQGAPGSNYGTQPTILVSNYTGASANYGFVSFVVEDFVSITAAKLHVFVTDGAAAKSNGGVKIRVASEAWDQYNLTWNSPGKPDVLSSTIADFTGQAIASNAFLTADVKAEVTGNGVYAFRYAASNMAGDDITFRTMNYFAGPPNDYLHQCNGKPCVFLEITGTRNTPSFDCPSISASQAGVLPTSNPNLSQDSGFTASAKYDGLFYAHADRSTSSQLGKFYLLGPLPAGGSAIPTVATYTLSNVSAIDTEEIQVGPGPGAKTSYVYLGDIGNNEHNQMTGRSEVQIFRVPEPTQATQSLTAEVLKLKYPNGWQLNSEAFLIDPINGNLYVIEKPCGSGSGTTLGVNRIFMLHAPLPFGNSTAVTLEDTFYSINMGADSGGCSTQTTAAGSRATGAAITLRTGHAVAVTFYTQTKFWWRHGNINLPSLLAYDDPVGPYGWKCDLNTQSFTNDPKREAVTFAFDGSTKLWTTGEGSSHPVWKY